MKTELRLTLEQEPISHPNNVRVGLIFGDGESSLPGKSLLAIANDTEGISLISVLGSQTAAGSQEDRLRKVFRYAISRALGVKEKGEIKRLAGEAEKYVSVSDTSKMKNAVWKRTVLKKLIVRNYNMLFRSVEALRNNSDIAVSKAAAQNVFTRFFLLPLLYSKTIKKLDRKSVRPAGEIFKEREKFC